MPSPTRNRLVPTNLKDLRRDLAAAYRIVANEDVV